MSGTAAPVAVRRGDALVVLKGAELPRVCVKCGARDGLTSAPRTFGHVPSWIWLTLLIGLVWPFVLLPFVRKTGRAVVSLCGPCGTRWARARTLGMVAALGIPVALVLLVVALVNGRAALALLSFGALVLVPIAVELAVVRPGTLMATGMDAHWMWLKGVHPRAWQGLVPAEEPPRAELVSR
jgi:hypothetical protein